MADRRQPGVVWAWGRGTAAERRRSGGWEKTGNVQGDALPDKEYMYDYVQRCKPCKMARSMLKKDTSVYTHAHTHIHVYTHAHTHTHMYTQTHINSTTPYR